MKKSTDKIILCGFMGCGKTTVGKRLAALKRCAFADLDQEIERREQLTVPEIFSRHGEARFRDAEHAALLALLGIDTASTGTDAIDDSITDTRAVDTNMTDISTTDSITCIIATGGGALTFERNILPARANAIVVLLDPGFEVCYRRIKGDTNRPIAQANSREQLRALYDARQTHYRAAAHIVVDEATSAAELAAIIDALTML